MDTSTTLDVLHSFNTQKLEESKLESFKVMIDLAVAGGWASGSARVKKGQHPNYPFDCTLKQSDNELYELSRALERVLTKFTALHKPTTERLRIRQHALSELSGEDIGFHHFKAEHELKNLYRLVSVDDQKLTQHSNSKCAEAARSLRDIEYKTGKKPKDKITRKLAEYCESIYPSLTGFQPTSKKGQEEKDFTDFELFVDSLLKSKGISKPVKSSIAAVLKKKG